MARFIATLLLVLTAGCSALGQDLGGPHPTEEVPHQADIPASISVEDEDVKVLEGMDKPEEPLAEILDHESAVHDLDDHQMVWAHDSSEHDDLALTELEASGDPGPLPNFALSQGDKVEGDDDTWDVDETPPEERGEPSNVWNPDGSFPESEADLAKDRDAVNLVDYGSEQEGNATGEVSMMNIMPEKGDKVPHFAHSFPGCGCDYAEWQKKWTCSGTIAAPKKVSGKDCCCCTMSCDRRNRCEHETCDAIGIDQRAEVNRAEADRKAKLGDADAMICNVKMYRVSTGVGRCGLAKILAACKAIGKTPVCDHQSYSGRGNCYSPGKAGIKECTNIHFSHGGHLRSKNLNVMDFYGHCFVTTNGAHALTPTGESHTWSYSVSTITLNDPGTAGKIVQKLTAAQIDSQSALGGWSTYCTDNKPN